MSRTARVLPLAIVLLLAQASISFCAKEPAPPGPVPNIQIDDTVWDAGKVVRGETISHDFLVKNTGKALLEIYEARPSCGCTVTNFDKSIPAGGTGKVHASIDTGKLGPGESTKTVTIRSNDPDQPQIFLQLKSTVVSYVDVLPPTLNIRADRGKGGSASVLLRPAAGNTISKIERVEPSLGRVTSKVTKIEKADPPDAPTPIKAAPGDYKIEVFSQADAPVGSQTGIVRVFTSSTKTPKIEIPVSVLVTPLVSAIPARVNFRLLIPPDKVRIRTEGVVVRETPDAKSRDVARVDKAADLSLVEEQGDWFHVRGPNVDGWVLKRTGTRVSASPEETKATSTVRTVTLVKKDASDFRVDRVEVDPGLAQDLGYTVTPLKEGQSYSITLTYKGAMSKGTRSGSVTIFTNDKTEGKIDVPVSITIS